MGPPERIQQFKTIETTRTPNPPNPIKTIVDDGGAKDSHSSLM
jgi:hypothetical protein